MWNQPFNRAYVLAVQCNHAIILHDLSVMTELELAGVISFLMRLQDRSNGS